jgi:D-alanine-D-alanine ligase
MADVPYSGSGPTCLGLCYDKAAVRAIAAAHDVPVPAEQFVGPEMTEPPLPDRYPALIKPCTGDGSVGITAESVVETPAEAEGYMAHLRDTFPGRALLVQPFLTGAEYTVGLIGNPDAGYDALPPLVVDYGNLNPDLPPILAYESKADSSSDYWNQIAYRKADLESALYDKLVGHAQTLARRLGCRDYVRVDFRCDAGGQPFLLEVNPNPAWCWDGKMNIMAGFRGDSYADFLRGIIEAARRRIAE